MNRATLRALANAILVGAIAALGFMVVSLEGDLSDARSDMAALERQQSESDAKISALVSGDLGGLKRTMAIEKRIDDLERILFGGSQPFGHESDVLGDVRDQLADLRDEVGGLGTLRSLNTQTVDQRIRVLQSCVESLHSAMESGDTFYVSFDCNRL